MPFFGLVPTKEEKLAAEAAKLRKEGRILDRELEITNLEKINDQKRFDLRKAELEKMTNTVSNRPQGVQ